MIVRIGSIFFNIKYFRYAYVDEMGIVIGLDNEGETIELVYKYHDESELKFLLNYLDEQLKEAEILQMKFEKN